MNLRYLTLISVLAAVGCATTSRSSSPTRSVDNRDAAACTRPDAFGPVLVPRERFESRNGAQAASFSALSTSLDRPLEECGIPATLQKLVALRCDDGSNPFNQDLGEAHASRRGSVGPGGQCGSMIDVYEIACPERRYEVFSDIYVCPQN